MNKNIGDMTNDELKDFIMELTEENSRYERQLDLYKSVIDEVREYIKIHSSNGGYLDVKEVKESLEILSKAKVGDIK